MQHQSDNMEEAMDVVEYPTVDDLSQLSELNQDVILQSLKERYSRDNIYTNCGDILIALNPCKALPLFGQEHHDLYAWYNYNADVPPHVFNVAAAAYRRLRETGTDQVVMVSGESGAGKTESTKYMVKHVVHMCNKGSTDLHEKIIKMNPLLEAFGNAKTIMNNNSSRFAKFLELSFDGNWELTGATVRDYMLEKSRVVTRSEGEGNFHIFYSLFAGAPKAKKKELNLVQPVQYYRIMKSDEDSLSISNEDFYKQMYKDQMDVLDKLHTDKETLHNLLASVIHLTEITFKESTTEREAVEVADAEPFAFAADLLGVSAEELGHALIANKITVRGETIVTYKSKDQADDGRDALAKMIYERMFGWLVREINSDLHPTRSSSNIAGKIAVLDIAGFEKLHDNSFEQLCINIVNEKLQNFTNDHVFIQEMKIYQAEGIGMEGVQFVNNDAILQMFEKPRTGMLALLDEQTKLQQGTDTSFVQELNRYFDGECHYVKAKGNDPEFGINHFAGMVWYKGRNFLEKNRDRLGDLLEELMKSSKDDFIQDLFTVKRGPTGTISDTPFNYRKSKKALSHYRSGQRPGDTVVYDLTKSLKKRFGEVKTSPKEGITQVANKQQHATVISYFKGSLFNLLEKMRRADSAFVRCLKPNRDLQPDSFHDQIVKDQLRYNGLAEIAKIRSMGFSIRRDYSVFLKRYRFMVPGPLGMTSLADTTKNMLLSNLPGVYHHEFRCGKTKVFMKEHIQLWLEEYLRVREKHALHKVVTVLRIVAEKRKEERRIKQEQERLRKLEEEKQMKIRAELEQKESEKEEAHLGKSSGIGASSSSVRPNLSTKGLSFNFAAASTNGNASSLTFADSSRDTWGASEKGASYRGSLGESTQGPQFQTLRETIPIDNRYANRPPSPPLKHTVESGEETDAERSKKQEKPFWDIFQVIAREKKVPDVHEYRSLKIIKVITYMVLFLFVFFCMVCQKVSLAVLTNAPHIDTNVANSTAERELRINNQARHIAVTIAIVCPYGLIFMVSVMKWLFGNLPRPQLATFLTSIVTETIHSVGLCYLAFKVLPVLDMARGIMLLSAVAFLPGLLKFFCSSEAKQRQNTDMAFGERCLKSLGKNVILMVDVFAILVQLAALPFLVLYEKYNASSTASFSSSENEYMRSEEHTDLIVAIAIGMIFVSISWWENFTDDKLCGTIHNNNNIFKKFILSVKFDLQESRNIITTFTSLWKIGITVLMAWVLEREDLEHEDFPQYMEKLDELKYAIITLTLAGWVGHYFAYTACKLQLQVVSFALPLLLSTPVAILVVSLDCEYEYLDFLTNDAIHYTCVEYWLDPLNYVAGFLWLASMYWIARHVWFPRQERLAKIERLFINPYYCGILLEQHILLNRRRHNRKVLRSFNTEGRELKVTFRLSEYDTTLTDDGETEDNSDETYIRNRQKDCPPKIYACATMWHETKNEMTQLLKSIFRMDRDQFVRRQSEILSGKKDDEFYEFEAHILFDDAIEKNEKDEPVPNDFVKLLVSLMDEAASSVYERPMTIRSPFKIPTPYGGQLVWEMPGTNFIFCHLKDKSKIRIKKRWSQVMYMYYLLGFRIIRMCQETVLTAMETGKINDLVNMDTAEELRSGHVGKSLIFQALDEEVIRQASNTFILALDGDVDFTPGAVRLLLDRMKKSDQVGASCGRIHPIGAGPIVWYQKFEYAIAHWLQKATEHVLGCVLCSPGCFSLFRGSALMDDNMMKKYTTVPTEAIHHLMYDQGEDRWLCTLLLQQGYRVDYAAASDAYTYAPEGFAEFFNQRRRWTPSTVANIVDLLKDYKTTVSVNSNISILYIAYQVALLLSTVIGPATVLMMIAGAIEVVFKTNIIWSYILALAPAVFYFIFCLLATTKWQLLVAEVLSAIYAFIMMIVLVGSIVTAAENSPFHPSVIFIALLVFMFAFAAMLHPREWSCVVFGMLYYLCVPTGYLLLVIYSLCNLNVISWGTREIAKKKTKEEAEKEKQEAELKKRRRKEQGLFGRFFQSSQMKDLTELVTKITESRKQPETRLDGNSELLKEIREMNRNIARLVDGKNKPDQDLTEPKELLLDVDASTSMREKSDPEKPAGILVTGRDKKHVERKVSISSTVEKVDFTTDEVTEEPTYDTLRSIKKRDELVNPIWAEDKALGNGMVMKMFDEELTFWKGLIEKYLTPLQPSEDAKKTTKANLRELRNNACLGLAMINILWIAINFMFQFDQPTTVEFSLSALQTDYEEDEETPPEDSIKVDILGLAFIFFFLIILGIQFVGMIIHRWGTFLHLVSITQLRNPFTGIDVQDPEQGEGSIDPQDARRVCEQLLADPLPDYPSSDEDEEDEEEQRRAVEFREQLQNIAKTGSRFGISVTDGGIGASSRMLGRSLPQRPGLSAHPRDSRHARAGLGRSRNFERAIHALAARSLRITARDEAPESDRIRREIQISHREAVDPLSRENGIPQPQANRKFGNFSPFQQDFLSKMKERNISTTGRRRQSNNLIPEGNEEEEPIYDEIPGTLGKHLGKKLALLHRRVKFQEVRDSTRSSDYNDRHQETTTL